MNRPIAVILAAATIALAGCSATAPIGHETAGATAPSSTTVASTAAPAASTAAAAPAVPGAASAWQFVSMGNATVHFFLPADVTDPRLAEIEAFRKDAGAAPVSYIIAEVDNRDGLEDVNMYMVSAYDADGKEYKFTRVDGMISEWGPTYSSDLEYVLPDGTKMDEAAGDALSRRGTELHNANLDDVNIGQRSTVILASTTAKLPATFTRVGVQPAGMSEQQLAVLVADAAKD